MRDNSHLTNTETNTHNYSTLLQTMEHDNVATASIPPPPEWTPPTTLDAVPFRVHDDAVPPTYGVAMGEEEPVVAAAAPAGPTRCVALTHRGKQCCRLSMDNSEYCGQHHRIISDPARKNQWLRRQQDQVARQAAAARSVAAARREPAARSVAAARRAAAARREAAARSEAVERREAAAQSEAAARRAAAGQRLREQYDEKRRLNQQHRQQQQKEFDEEVKRVEVSAKQKKWEKLPWVVRICTTSPVKRRQREEARGAAC